MNINSLTVRCATDADAEIIFSFINDLAIYEKAPHEVVTNVADIRKTLFGDSSHTYALIAEIDDNAVGYAVYFFSYSTWLGKSGIYLEDLYVSPASRGVGAGKALLKEITKIAVDNNCGRVEWSVLDWNKPAIDFYQSFGANPQDEWTVFRLTGDALSKFANS
jgi:GNAT superfamily N-acetyltransferase